ncbi:MAG: hypothetical protein RLZZ127_193 [Planctomycetota bacterium]|jgi:hypothetical protein
MDPGLRDTALIAVSTGMAVLIWLVQTVIYPAFHHIRPDVFTAWHRAYTGIIAVIVVPLMVCQAGLVAWRLSDGRADAATLVLAACVAMAWAATFLLSVPCHDRLQRHGHDPEVIRRLVATNGIRTAAWTIAAIAACLPPS